jgi:hypothetical protein
VDKSTSSINQLFVLEHDTSVGLAGKRDEAFEPAWIE